MSKIVAEMVIRGSHDIYKQASDFLDKAIKEKGGSKNRFSGNCVLFASGKCVTGGKGRDAKRRPADP